MNTHQENPCRECGTPTLGMMADVSICLDCYNGTRKTLPIPEKSSVGLKPCPSFEEWWTAFDKPNYYDQYGVKRSLAESAWHARDAQVAELEAALRIAGEASDQCRQQLYAPDKNCSCHINPPCSDCEQYASVRETIKEVDRAISLIQKTLSRDLPK